MRIGVATEETWSFLHEIYADLQAHHTVSLYERQRVKSPAFEERINRYLFARDLRRFLQSNDVVFFEWASHLLVAASHMPKICPIVTRLHRYEMYEWADKINWANVDKIILVSEAKRHEFAARFPDHAHKVIVINEGVPLDKFVFQPRAFTGNLGIMCHLRPRKRVYSLILSFYELLQERPGFHLYIGGGLSGDFPEYPTSLRQLVRRLNLQDYITFDDRVTDAPNWYRKIDIFISNSYSEGLQVSPMEAIASGCYCLSHWWDGAEELLPESELYLTDREMQRKILQYADLTAEARLVHLRALHDQIRTNFDMARISAQIRGVIEEAGARQ